MFHPALCQVYGNFRGTATPTMSTHHNFFLSATIKKSYGSQEKRRDFGSALFESLSFLDNVVCLGFNLHGLVGLFDAKKAPAYRTVEVQQTDAILFSENILLFCAF